jgi:hypothetical protein
MDGGREKQAAVWAPAALAASRVLSVRKAKEPLPFLAPAIQVL